MTQDTIPPYRFEVVKYISAISGTDTVYKFETVPVYLDHSRANAIQSKPVEVEFSAQKTAFDYIQPCPEPIFNDQKPMAEKYKYLLEKQPTPEKQYPMNVDFQACSLCFVIGAFFVLTYKLHLLYANFCRTYRP